MSSRIEDLVSVLINGGSVSFAPNSRVEQYLQNCIDGSGTDGLPTPDSRIEILLWQLADNINSGGGGVEVDPDSIATDKEVTEMLDGIFGTTATDEDIATDDEVNEILNSIFNMNIAN